MAVDFAAQTQKRPAIQAGPICSLSGADTHEFTARPYSARPLAAGLPEQRFQLVLV